MSENTEQRAAMQSSQVPAALVFELLQRIDSKLDKLGGGHSDLDKRVALLEAENTRLVGTNAATEVRIRNVESMRSQAVGFGICAGLVAPFILKALHL